MLKLITKNFGIKVLCVFISAILWVYISSTQNTITKFPGSLTIKAINVPSGYTAVFDTKTVEIKIMADSAVWKQLSTESFTAFVDLANYKEGTHEIPVTVTSSVTGVTIVEGKPDKIYVSLEPIITKEVGLNKKIEGNAGDGFSVGETTFDTEKVNISGPKSYVDNISEATVLIDLNNEQSNFEKSFPVYAFDEKGEIIKSISVTPAQVLTKVAIIKSANSKTVGVKVVTTGQVKTGYFVSNITSNPPTIDIAGSKDVLVDIKYLETENIDLTNISSNNTQDVSLKLPTNISLTASASQKVKVTISVSPIEITKELTLSKIEASNLNSYKVTSISEPIKIMCSGPADLINNLNNSVPILLDFKGKSISSSPSTIAFDNLSQKNFKVPDGVTITSILPSSISVEVSL